MADQKKEESMPAIYKHEVEWEVTIGKKIFSLNDEQLKILKDMSLAGKSSIVWFDKFAISIPHISCIELVEDKYYCGTWWRNWNQYQFTEITKEDFEKNNKDLIL